MNRVSIKKVFRAMTLIAFVIISCFTISGCDDVDKYISSVTRQDYEDRRSENLNYIKVLKECGAIDETMEKTLSSYFKPYDEFVAELSTNQNLGRLKSATTKVYNGNAVGGVIKQAAKNTIPWGEGSSELKDVDLFKKSGIHIWKMKYSSQNNGIDTVVKAVSYISSGHDDEGNELTTSEVNNYIIRYFEDTGIDLYPDDIPILKATEPNKSGKNGTFGKDFVIFYKTYNSNGEEGYAPWIDVRMLEINKDYVDIVTNSSSYSGGKYLLRNNQALLVSYPVHYVKTIKSDGGKFKIETDKAGMLVNIATGALEKYVVSDDNVIENTVKININSTTNKLFPCTEDDVNVLLGKLRPDETNTITKTETYTEKTEGHDVENSESKTIQKETSIEQSNSGNGYKLSTSKLFSDKDNLSNSSFTMLNTGGEKYTYREKTQGKDGDIDLEFSVDVNPIILKDYLELTPTPAYEKYGNYTPLGRRIRFTDEVIHNGGSMTDTWAMYIDNSGSNMFPSGADTSKTTVPIRLDDIVGVESDNNKVYKVTDGEEKEVAGTATEDTLGKKVGFPGSAISYKNSIDVGLLFLDDTYWNGVIPEDDTRLKDIIKKTYGSDGDTKQIMYGVKIVKDIYDTSLYSIWLTSNDAHNSSVWWNNWLSLNGFAFRLDLDDLLGGSEKELQYELAKKQNISLDMDKIEKIQHEIDVENGKRLMETVRTIFACLGIILMAYSLALPCAWLFDTNIVMGPKLLTIMTFGKWVAVKEKDEVLEMASTRGSDEDQYMDLKGVLIGAVIVLAVGVLFTSFDIIQLIVVIVKAAGNTVKWLSNLIFR